MKIQIATQTLDIKTINIKLPYYYELKGFPGMRVVGKLTKTEHTQISLAKDKVMENAHIDITRINPKKLLQMSNIFDPQRVNIIAKNDYLSYKFCVSEIIKKANNRTIRGVTFIKDPVHQMHIQVGD